MTLLYVIAGVIIGLIIEHFIIQPIQRKRAQKYCEEAGLIPIQWFYRRR